MASGSESADGVIVDLKTVHNQQPAYGGSVVITDFSVQNVPEFDNKVYIIGDVTQYFDIEQNRNDNQVFNIEFECGKPEEGVENCDWVEYIFSLPRFSYLLEP